MYGGSGCLGRVFCLEYLTSPTYLKIRVTIPGRKVDSIAPNVARGDWRSNKSKLIGNNPIRPVVSHRIPKCRDDVRDVLFLERIYVKYRVFPNARRISQTFRSYKIELC